MNDLGRLIKEIESLPKGYVYKKKIKNRTYFYHQFSNNGIKQTKIVKYEDVKKLISEIEIREKKKIQLKKILNQSFKNLKLSNSSKEYSGYIMSANKILAEFNKGNLIRINNKLCPLIIKRTKRIEPFLRYRCIDETRTNSRILKKVLNLKETSKERISISTYSISLTDNYWFKPKHSKLKYKDISSFNDIFFDLSLKGETSIYFNRMIISPDLTTNGSYEKAWKLIDKEWYLYKAGNKEEIFSELFYSNLFKLLNLPTADYEYEDGYIKTKNFSSDYNFEPMVSIADDDSSIENVFDKLMKIDISIAKDYLRLVMFDVVLNNIDRHNENTGLLRDKKTGKIICLAPNYDDNLSLISRSKFLNTSLDEGFLSFFIKVVNNNKLIKDYLKEIKFPEISEDILDKCFDKCKIDIDIDRLNIKKFIINRYKHLLDIINK